MGTSGAETGYGGGTPAARRLLELLGLAARAGAIVTGTEGVRKGVRDEQVQRAVLAADASETQRKKLVPLLDARGVPYGVLFTQAELGQAVGRSPVSAVGITSGNFARRAGELIGAIPGAGQRGREPRPRRGMTEGGR